MTNLLVVEIVPESLQLKRTQVKHQINHRFVQPGEATRHPTQELPIIQGHPTTVIQPTPVRQIRQPDHPVLPEERNPAVFLTPRTEITTRITQTTNRTTQDHRRDHHPVHQDRLAAIRLAVHQVQAAQAVHPAQAVIHQADHHPAPVAAQAVVPVEAQPDLQVADLPGVQDDNCRNIQ